MDATVDSWVFVIVPDMETEARGVNIAMTPEQKSAKDGLGEEVQNTVEDSLGVWGDDIAALADTPCDRVQQP